MPSKLFYATQSNLATQGLASALGSAFKKNVRVENGVYLGRNRILVGGQEYQFHNGDGQNINVGATIAVQNIGRKAAAIYASADSPTGFVVGGGGGGGGGETTVLSGMAGIQDSNHLRVLPDASGYVRIHGDGAGILTVLGDSAYNIGLGINVNLIDHNGLTNLTTGDPHTQYPLLTGAETVTGLWSFSRSTNPPFAVNSGAAVVANLDADKLDGLDKTDFLSPQYLTLATNANLTGERVLVAGLGLGLTDGGAGGNATLAVGQGAGLTVNANDVALTTPGGLSVSSTNNSTGNHTHAITSSSNPGAAASLLATDGSGYLSLLKINVDTIADKSGGNLTVAPAGDVLLNPAGLDVRLQSSVTLRSENFASQTTGWGIDYLGAADFRYLYADEMHVKSFIADLEQALAGGQIISKSVAVLAVAFTAPAAGAATTLTVRDLPSAAGMAAFQSGDIVRLRSFNRASGSLTIGDCWGVVTSYVPNGDDTQSWTFTRSSAPNAGAMTAGTVIQPDAIVLDYGTTGNGIHEVNAIDGVYAANSPYSQIVTWTTHPATGSTVRTRLGNLKGITSQTNEFGLWAGQNTTDKYLRLSSAAFETHGLRMSLYDGASETIRLDPAVPSIGLGATLPTAFGQAGIWMGRHSDGTYRLSMEEAAGDQYLRWTHDGSRYLLDIAGDIWLHDSPGAGGDDLGPTLTIDSYGKIDMGANSYIAMGASSSFAAAAGSTFTVGTQGSGAYLSYANGELLIEGKLTVTDGKDFLPKGYRVRNFKYNPFTAYVLDANTLSCSFSGIITMATNGKYVLSGINTVSNYFARSGVTSWTVFIYKDGTGIYSTEAGRDVLGIENSGVATSWNGEIGPLVDYFILRDNEYAVMSGIENTIPIAYVKLTSGYDDVSALLPVGEAGASTVGPDYIYTQNLSAISANMGSITAGTITVTNGTNTLWLNNGTNDIVLAAGSTAGGIASAVFRLKEDGALHVGGVSDNYLDWSGSTLTINGSGAFSGAITATSGSLGSMTVSGDLNIGTAGALHSGSNSGTWGNVLGYRMEYNGGTPRFVVGVQSGGALDWGMQWDGQNLKVRMIDSDKARLYIGDTTRDGFIDIDTRLGSGPGIYKSGIHISDGGNDTAGVQALFYGNTAVAGDNAVDRIFEATTTNGAYSDGFFGQMAGTNTWNDFDTKGTVFKGAHLAGGPVAMFNQHNGGADAPVIWVTSDNDNRSMIISEMGRNGQVAFRVIDNGYAGYSLWTDGQKIDMGDGRIESVNMINFTTSVSGIPPWTPVVNFGGASNRTVTRWLRLEVAGTIYQIPLFDNGAFQ